MPAKYNFFRTIVFYSRTADNQVRKISLPIKVPISGEASRFTIY